MIILPNTEILKKVSRERSCLHMTRHLARYTSGDIVRVLIKVQQVLARSTTPARGCWNNFLRVNRILKDNN